MVKAIEYKKPVGDQLPICRHNAETHLARALLDSRGTANSRLISTEMSHITNDAESRDNLDVVLD